MNRSLYYIRANQPTASRRTSGREGVKPLVRPPSEPTASQPPVFDLAGQQANGGSSLEGRFRALVHQWQEATALTSSITEMATHPAYQQIIGMGREVLPLIFEELRRQLDHWFWALKAITGEDPVAPADRGRLRRMAEAWLAWAKDHGY